MMIMHVAESRDEGMLCVNSDKEKEKKDSWA